MKKIGLILLLFIIAPSVLFAQNSDIERNVKERLTSFFNQYATTANISTPKLKNLDINYEKKTITIEANESFAFQPFLPETIDKIYHDVKELLPGPVNYFDLKIYTDGKMIEELVPNLYRKRKKDKERLSLNIDYKDAPWVRNASRPYNISRGLQNRHLALWQSHGSYYKNDQREWGWQRPRLFCTTEDLFTQSFIIPYVIPMLENAGASIYTPRERDTQKNEVIVDNDIKNGSIYIEVNGKKTNWQTASKNGFAQRKTVYQDGDNPFIAGTCRTIATEKKKKKEKDQPFAEWIPTIPATGSYAVYVSYQSFPNSIPDAKYLVFHKGGVTEFTVNQRIGGGTWVYLGTFEFDKGNNDYGMVALSNESTEKGVVCADAVRFGGGMGNISRGGQLSGLPRYLEGARYSAQWSGMPYEVYGGRKGENDYIDDINTRSNVINYLSGGSVYNPNQAGLGVPIELTMALHSDAGYSKTDEIIGSLGIYTTDYNNGKLNSGIDRYASRDLTDILLTQIEKDVKATYNSSWTRRSMWNRNYSETRLPATPSTIIELLSHQNFADMKIGHDPQFKFTVGRAIYKGLLRFIGEQHNKEYVVQPLPISHFAIEFTKKNTIKLSWKGEDDPLEPTARPQEYMVYTRIGYGGFDNGTLVSKSSYTLKIEPGLVYSFKVTAVNKGGESFPSEILSAYKAKREKDKILIINGFDRVSGPAIIDTESQAGFDLNQDPGVPYLYNISLCGQQVGFDRSQAGKEGKGSLGYSTGEMEGMKVVGNTFDYPFIHGKAIQASGRYSFVSCSDEAVESGIVSLEKYPIVDYILGLEKEGSAEKKDYKTFSSAMQRVITSYCQSGGDLLVSGSYLGSDMSNSQGNREFTEKILKYGFQSSLTDRSSGQIKGLGRTVSIPRTANEKAYAVTTPECIVPVDTAFPVFTYASNNQSAGIAYKGNYRTFILGFPFESIESETDRATIMAAILGFFSDK